MDPLLLSLIVVALVSYEFCVLATVAVVVICSVLAIVKLVYGFEFGHLEEKMSFEKRIGPILDVEPTSRFEALKPTQVRFRIKNILDTFGIRIRFRSVDYINPQTLDLVIPPGGEVVEDVIIIPLGSGRREFAVAYAKLYDEDGYLIPSEAADDIDQQKFAYYAQERTLGLSSRQKSILSALIKFAVFLSASGIIYLSILRLKGLETFLFIITKVVPIITILQVPALMLLFYLNRQLPEKPTFVFEEGEG